MSTTKNTVETLLVDEADGVALVTVNRPDVRNALSRQGLADQGANAFLEKRSAQFRGR